MALKTFASTNLHLFAASCHCGFQKSRKFSLEFCNSDKSLNYKLPYFRLFLGTDQELVLVNQDSGLVKNTYL
jgi:hypothetical protein